jgi:hypothetical protein
MSSSVAPVLTRQATPLWSFSVAGAVRGLSLAREAGSLLIRDDTHWLYLLDRKGAVQAQLPAPKELTASAGSDEGGSFAVGGKEGELWWLAPDLMPRWQRGLGKRVEGLAMDSLGQYLAASDSGGEVYMFTRKGQLVWKVRCPRPLRFLSFIPEQPFVVGSADYGLVTCLDQKGETVWRDGLVAHVGSLASSGDGSSIVLACYTDGLNRYSVKSSRPERQPLSDPCRLAALSYDGRAVLTAGLLSVVTLRDDKGRRQGEHKLPAPAVALALSALAERAVIGTAAGLVSCFRWG